MNKLLKVANMRKLHEGTLSNETMKLISKHA
jgi:hypothetical protein